jgi:uncharacterized protein YbjT (DUF2867 family)
MRVAVAGGTGVVGRYVVTALESSGHEPIALARSKGVDVVTRDGLDDSMHGVDAVVDVTNVQTLNREKATQFFTSATRNLLAAEARAGVRHHVLLSIVGVDRVPMPYYQAKLTQEEAVATGDVPFTVLRATQFHEFPGQVLARMPGPIAVLPRMRMQPVAAQEVGAELARLATSTPEGATHDMAGSEVHEIVDLARRVVRAEGRHRWVVGVRFPGSAGKGMAAGELLPKGPATLGTVRFADWLASASD